MKECADGRMIVLGRGNPSTCSAGRWTSGNNKTIEQLTRNGEVVDAVIFGFVAQDGSWLHRLETPTGEKAPANQGYHALSVYPLNGEYQRSLAFLYHVFAPTNQRVQFFARGNAWQATTLWGDSDRYQGT